MTTWRRRVLVIGALAVGHWAVSGGTLALTVLDDGEIYQLGEDYDNWCAYVASWFQLPLVGIPLWAIIWFPLFFLEGLQWPDDTPAAWASMTPVASLIWAITVYAIWAGAKATGRRWRAR